MPRGTLVTTLYPAEIPWLEVSKHPLGDRSLLATPKGSWLGDTRAEHSILGSRCSQNPTLSVKCNSLTQRGQSRALCGVTPECPGVWGHCKALVGTALRAAPNAPSPSLHCKNHHCALSKATFTGLVYFISIEIEKSGLQVGSEWLR